MDGLRQDACTVDQENRQPRDGQCQEQHVIVSGDEHEEMIWYEREWDFWQNANGKGDKVGEDEAGGKTRQVEGPRYQSRFEWARWVSRWAQRPVWT